MEENNMRNEIEPRLMREGVQRLALPAGSAAGWMNYIHKGGLA